MRRSGAPNEIRILALVRAIQAGVKPAFTHTHKRIPGYTIPANPAAHLATVTLAAENAVIQPTIRVLHLHSVLPSGRVGRVIPERQHRSVPAALKRPQVQFSLVVKIRRQVDTTRVGGSEEKEAKGYDGGTRVHGSAEVVVGGVADGRGFDGEGGGGGCAG